MKTTIYIIVFLLCYTAYSQNLSVFDLDATSFPTIKAHFYAFDANWQQISNLSISDFDIKEDGIKRTVTYVSCPSPQPPKALSSTLVLDASGSMGWDLGGYKNLDLAQAAARAWVQALPLGKSECAITSFNGLSYLNQDFTTDRNKLLDAINKLVPSDGTNYNMAYIDLLTSGIPITKSGKYKRVLVFLSDGQPNFEPQTQQIIDLAVQNNITIYAVTLRMSCPQCLKDISTKTGGLWYENVTSIPEAETIYRKILMIAQNIGGPCTIEWESDYSCNKFRNGYAVLLKPIATSNFSYTTDNFIISRLSIQPAMLYFGGVQPPKTKDTTFVIKAINRPLNVNAIMTNHARFSILNYGGTNPPFTLQKNEQRTIALRYTAPDSGFVYSWLDIETDACSKERLYLSAGFENKLANQSLKLLFPNGGEEFLVGIDTVITWEGVLPTEIVKLEYSINSGSTWNLITNSATGLKYKWKGVPNTPSKKCLAKVSLGMEQSLCGCDMPGIVACYPFNGNANDETGNNHNGTKNGSVTLTSDRFGNANKAYNFSGGNITVPTAGFHNPNFTISCWVKPVTSTCYYDGPVIFSDYDGYYNGNTLTLRKNGKVDIGISGGSGTKSYTCRSNNVAPLNQWSFITASYNGSVLNIYINGNLENTLAGPYFTFSTKTLLKIGDSSWSGDYHFNGTIDDIKIFNRAITEYEIKCLYNSK
jgi:hypothetical protein